MTTVRTNAAPNPAIFASDPLEQIHAKQLYDPASSGYALAFLNKAMGDRGANVADYLSGLQQANAQNVEMQKLETQQKADSDLAKLSHGLAKDLGVDFSQLPALARAFGGAPGQAAAGADSGRLAGDVMRAKIAAAHAQAAKGGGGGEQERLQLNTPDGVITSTSKKGTGLTDDAVARAQARAASLRDKGYTGRETDAAGALEKNRR